MRRAGLGVRWGLALGLLLLLACTGEPEQDDHVERLRALGYIDYAEEPAHDDLQGVVIHDPTRSDPGYTLVTYPVLRRAELLDAEGRVVWKWSLPGEMRWERAELQPGGELLVSRLPSPVRLDADGRILTLWKLPTHHRLTALPGNRLLTLTIRRRQFDDGSPIWDNGIALLSDSGGLIKERSLLDAIRSGPETLEIELTEPVRDGTIQRYDLFHTNFVQWLDDPALSERDPLYRRGNVLLTIRHQDVIAIVDFEAGRLLWAWGRGELLRPHDATLLENGHVLIFDNRTGEKASRIVELDPLSEAIVWQYRPGPGFYSRSRGTVQRLGNGNTLVGESNRGRIFEVTPGGEIVWEYRTPHVSARGRRAVLRAARYPAELVAPLLERSHRG
jgi:hypothetical protein